MEASAGKSAPTGCYKCGRPGHWSRDCPDSNPNSSSFSPSSNVPYSAKPPAAKPKKVPRTRPKLTPDLFLGDEGLGYVLRHFPRNFKYRGRGNEVSDLGNLLRLYNEWHKQLLPYYSFYEFVCKVEQVAASKRVKLCINDLRDRVERGGDPTKLRDTSAEQFDSNSQQDHTTPAEAMNPEEFGQKGDQFAKNHDVYISQESIVNENYDQATISEPTWKLNNSEFQQQSSGVGSFNDTTLTEQQKARMEANRQKAVERAAARARLLRSA